MKEKPADNRIFTGNDAELTHEQARNLMKSPEYVKHQKDLLKKTLIGNNDSYKQQLCLFKERDFAINLLRGSSEGNIMALILDCFFAGYSDKEIAKTLMKADTVVGNKMSFSSLTKAIKFVAEKREEAKFIVMRELDKLRIKPMLLN